MSAFSEHKNKLLRNKLRQSRRDIPDDIRSANDEAIREHLLQVIRTQSITAVACYWSFDGEPDLAQLCKQLMNDDCEIALPVVSGNNDCSMNFYRWETGTSLRQNQYGICEPHKTVSKPLAGFDMLLMPLVAYDKSGTRMGMGSGYYDRHLESLRELSRPLRIGVAYSLQEVDLISRNDWDIPLHGLVNEQGWIAFDE
jgi:5-formyltetrahydrofolate cyclo-ligase